MSPDFGWISHRNAIDVGWTLLHFAWQGAGVAAALGVARSLSRRASSELRYGTACAALTLLVLLPMATFVLEHSTSETTAPSAPPPLVQTAPPAGDASVAMATNAPSTWNRTAVEASFPYLVVIWLVGIAVLSLRFGAALAFASRVRRATRATIAPWQERCDELAQSMGVRRTVRLCESLMLGVPSVVGWFRPVVLMPAGIFVGLDARQIDAILAHELAHVRRYDYLVNLVQTGVETVLFYHPAVWWISRVIREEREHCCDDLAVATCGDPVVYARALAELDDLRFAPPAFAMAATGGALSRRIARILGRTPTHASSSANVVGAVTAAIVAATIAIAGAPSAAQLRSWGPPAIPARPSPPAVPAMPTTPTPPTVPSDVAVPAPPSPAAPAAPVDPPLPPLPPMPAMVGTDADDDGAPIQDSAYAAVGYPSLSRSQYEAFRWNDVTPDYIRSLADLGYRDIEPGRLVAMRVQGVDAHYIESLQSVGFREVSPSTLVAMKVQGIDADYVNELASAGVSGVSADALIAMRVQGVTSEYVRTLRDQGYGDLGWEALVAGRVQGVSASYARSWIELGFGRPPFETLIALRVQGVTAGYAHQLRDLGLSPTIDQLIELHVVGVSVAFARDALSSDPNTSVRRLIELRVRGE